MRRRKHGSYITRPVYPVEDEVYLRSPLVKHNTFSTIAAVGYCTCTQAALEQDDSGSWQGCLAEPLGSSASFIHSAEKG